MIDAEVQAAYDAQHPELAQPQEAPVVQVAPEVPLVAPEDIEHTPAVDVSPTVIVDKPPLNPVEPDADWFFAEGIPGKGEKPEYFNDKTFKTLADQAKAQTELRKKLASFTGSPEEGYEISLKEELASVEMDEEDPLLNQFAELASEMNMSQDGFNQVLNFYVEENAKFAQEESTQQETYWKAEYEKLGPNGAEDLKLLKQWAQHNIPDEMQSAFDDMVTTADSVKIFNLLMDKIIPSNVSHISAGTGLSRHNLQELMKDQKYGRDQDFTRHVDSEAQALYSIKKNSIYG
jgi:hypothetical protein